MKKFWSSGEMVKPGVGVVIFVRCWWMPWRVGKMFFRPEGRTNYLVVPNVCYEKVLKACSVEEAMAVIRTG